MGCRPPPPPAVLAPGELRAVRGASVLRAAGRGGERGGGGAGGGGARSRVSPASGSHLAPAAPQAAGRALPPQWPRPRQEAGGEPAGPAGRILPLRRRRRRGRYHGDRGGRPGLGGSGPPGVRRGAVGGRGPGARQARPTGWARCPRRKPRLNWGRRGMSRRRARPAAGGFFVLRHSLSVSPQGLWARGARTPAGLPGRSLAPSRQRLLGKEEQSGLCRSAGS
ncbi:uncharacterized protein [Canis lupus baileyi]|uniref:uncharacterized protein n=1 Tax=Canis lupus baileyi TaxID=143281 RepID=UPI003B97C6DB